MTDQRDLDRAAKRLAVLLEQHRRNIVFAESCTGGLVAATLTRVPGISARFCGSAVVYQVPTKQHWLDVRADILQRPGPVSREVALEMACGVLRHTPQADCSASVTGHLGPQAPPRQDGLIYIGLAKRITGRKNDPLQTAVRRFRLPVLDARSPQRNRHRRQKAAAQEVLQRAADWLRGRIRASAR